MRLLLTHAAGAAFAGAAFAGAGAEQPVPFVAVPGAYSLDGSEAAPEIAVTGRGGREIARYAIAACGVRAESPGAGGPDGVFAPVFPDDAGPLVVAVCHSAGGGQGLLVFMPARDGAAPVFVREAREALRYRLRPAGLEGSADDAPAETWSPGPTTDPETHAMVIEAAEMAAGRTLAAPEPPEDPELAALAGRLGQIAASRDGEGLVALAGPEILTSFGGAGTVDEFRQLIAEPWFWGEFERALAGGGALSPDWEDGRRAFFPAAFEDWPQDLDVYGYVYGDRPGAVLRAGPSERAPVLAELHLRILAEMPYSEPLGPLHDAGWVFGCIEPEGCGYARAEEVRSPIDWRAVFLQKAPGAPWVLETFVAGD